MELEEGDVTMQKQTEERAGHSRSWHSLGPYGTYSALGP
jgi:hypothetical protein